MGLWGYRDVVGIGNSSRYPSRGQEAPCWGQGLGSGPKHIPLGWPGGCSALPAMEGHWALVVVTVLLVLGIEFLKDLGLQGHRLKAKL